MKRISLRVEDEIHELLTLAAKEDRRSLNEEIVFAIQELLRKRSKRMQRAQKQESEGESE